MKVPPPICAVCCVAALSSLQPTGARLTSGTQPHGKQMRSEQQQRGSLVINVKELGAKGDGQTDDLAAIQAAVDKVTQKGGKVTIPASTRPYVVSGPIKISGSNVELVGAGATVKLVDPKARTEAVVLIEGQGDKAVENVSVRGLTVNANCWEQRGQELVCGVAVRRASKVSIFNVAVTNASVGIAIRRPASEVTVSACRVGQWDRSGYLVTGDGETGLVHHIEFTSCQASGSRDEANGGPPGTRFAGWEIADGCTYVRLTDCMVADADGHGFVVHNARSAARLNTSRIWFLRCTADKVGGFGWVLCGRKGEQGGVREIKLDYCRSTSACVLCCGADEVAAGNCKFEACVAIGFEKPDQQGLPQGVQAGAVRLEHCDLAALAVNLRNPPPGQPVPKVLLDKVNVRYKFVRVGPRDRLHAKNSSLPIEPPATAPIGKWMSMFDGKTLKGWKITDFGGQGDVYVKDECIYLEMGADLTGITWTGSIPRVDYEVELEAKRVDGNDFFCGLTFPVRDSCCSLILGGWGGTIVGISSLDGMDASENETTTFMEFEQNRWYKVRVRVTRSKIEAWIDDQKVVDTSIVGRQIDVRIEVELSKPFGIATWQTTGAIRNIRIRRLPLSPEPKQQK